MTAYFDDMDRRLRALGPDDFDGRRDWEQELVYDCSLASMMPNFPKEYREVVARAILAHAVVTAPDIAEPDFEDDHEYKRRLTNLSGDLHTVFHQVVTNGGISDSPRAYPRAVAAEAEELRDALAYQQADPSDAMVQRVASRQHASLVEFGIAVPPELQAVMDRIAALEG